MIVNKQRKISIKLFLLLFLIFPIIKPEELAVATILGNAVASFVTKLLWAWNLISYVVTFLLFVNSLKNGKKIKTYTWLMFALSISLLFSTLKIGNCSFKEIYQLLGNYLMIAVLASIYSEQKYLSFLQAWYYCITFWMAINSFTIYLYFHKGMYYVDKNTNYYLFGLDNVSFLISLTGFFIGFVYNKIRFKKIKFSYTLFYAFIGSSYFYCKAGTGMAITALCMLILIFYKTNLFKCLNYSKTLFVLIVSFLMIVVLQNVKWAAGLLDLIGKDLTYNGRLDIWTAAMRVLPNNFLFGYGITTEVVKNALSNGGIAWISGIAHLHDFILEFLFKGGIISLTLVILLFICPLKYMPSRDENSIISGTNLLLIAVWIAFIFEYRLNIFSFWVVLFTFYNIDSLLMVNPQYTKLKNGFV